MAYRMTPARRAALRKAQAASARKRRKGRLRRSVSREYDRKTRMATKRYAGAGGSYKMHKDRRDSTGPYSRNWRGKKYGKAGKRVNKVASKVAMANPGYSAVVAGSYLNGRRKGTIKKRTRVIARAR